MAHFTDIRALAFDLDGTLVDSAPGLADAIDRTLNDLRLPQAGLERVTTWIPVERSVGKEGRSRRPTHLYKKTA